MLSANRSETVHSGFSFSHQTHDRTRIPDIEIVNTLTDEGDLVGAGYSLACPVYSGIHRHHLTGSKITLPVYFQNLRYSSNLPLLETDTDGRSY